MGSREVEFSQGYYPVGRKKLKPGARERGHLCPGKRYHTVLIAFQTTLLETGTEAAMVGRPRRDRDC